MAPSTLTLCSPLLRQVCAPDLDKMRVRYRNARPQFIARSRLHPTLTLEARANTQHHLWMQSCPPGGDNGDAHTFDVSCINSGFIASIGMGSSGGGGLPFVVVYCRCGSRRIQQDVESDR